MSVDESASLHEGLSQVARHFSGERGLADGSVYWVAAYGLLFAAVGTRLFLEMRLVPAVERRPAERRRLLRNGRGGEDWFDTGPARFLRRDDRRRLRDAG